MTFLRFCEALQISLRLDVHKNLEGHRFSTRYVHVELGKGGERASGIDGTGRVGCRGQEGWVLDAYVIRGAGGEDRGREGFRSSVGRCCGGCFGGRDDPSCSRPRLH
ncbi:hypothetical protein THIOKS13220003 [Thiocapsa sp. KS1]|nr:hypothetical protein THIOKS13220003 [Thiocapsa sp. KS1]